MNKLNRPISLPDIERGRSDADVARWSKAREELGSDRLALNDKQKDARLKAMAQIEAAPGIDADKRWRAQAADETVMLAELRGEEVERPRSGGLRVNSRDPLASLLRGGHLTADQCWVGINVRELYEARFTGAGSQLGAMGGAGGAHDNDRFVFFQLRNAKALGKVAKIERAVALQAEPNALAMLRAVCGSSVSLSSQGEGRAFERNAGCLAAALDVAGEVLRQKGS